MSRLNDAGDTIVEVLIAITIVGLVLLAAYQSVGRSTRAIQDNQEHNQGLALAENQLEFLRSTGTIDTTTYQCFNPDGSGPATAASNSCQVTPNGPNGVIFKIVVTSDPVITNQYDVSVDWDGLLGSHAQVELYYHPPETS